MYLNSENRHEVFLNISNRIRMFFLESSEFRIREPGRKVNLNGGRILSFPVPGVEFDSIIIHGHAGLYHREISMEDNWLSRIVFNKDQHDTFELKEHRRSAGFIISSVDDSPEDLDAFFSAQTGDSIVPLVIPIIDPDRSELIESGEIIQGKIKGSVAVYAPPGEEGEAVTSSIFALLRQSLEKNSHRLSSHGIDSLELGECRTMTFPGMAESSADLEGVVNCRIQDDAYWTTIY